MISEFFEESGGNSSKIKRAVIAGAAHALKAKTENFKKGDNEILQEITANVNDILKEID